MFKMGPLPGDLAPVTLSAVLRESGSPMIGVIRFIVVPSVTGDTFLLKTGTKTLLVAVKTIQCFMNTLSLKSGFLQVIPGTGNYFFPSEGCVAFPAMVAKLELIPVILFPFPMACFALRRCIFYYPPGMTFGAGSGPVFPGEGEIRHVVRLDSKFFFFCI